jgi:hypothetical protein
MSTFKKIHTLLLEDINHFCEFGSCLKLRDYQREVCARIVESVLGCQGLSFVVIFPRQSGKNELQAQIEAFLLSLFRNEQVDMIKVSPTWAMQARNSAHRLKRVLERNLTTRGYWRAEANHILRVGSARITFLSAKPAANVVGATASLLLECDEAQEVQVSKWDKEFAPMAAACNATRVFWGTSWTSRTLLAREFQAAMEMQSQDGKQRAFLLTAEQVAREVPHYRQYVENQVARLGRNHSLIRTQYYSEEIDAESGMFPPDRQALMQGTHARQSAPQAGGIYALLLDVAGEDEAKQDEKASFYSQTLQSSSRNSTALTVVQVDLSKLEEGLLPAASYQVVKRYLWTGEAHSDLYKKIKALVEHWKARYLVVDATGVGAGLASFLKHAFPERVLPVLFSTKTKSDMGWKFLGIIETGRYKEYQVAAAGAEDDLQRQFWLQVAHCQAQVLEGTQKQMRWGVPDGTRAPQGGQLVHDDLLISAALCAELESLDWGTGLSGVIAAQDPLEGLDGVF